MKPDGTDVRQITEGPFNDYRPALSPDGRRIAFVSDRDGNFELYLLNVATSVTTRLTRLASTDTDPAFSSNGQRLYFSSDRSGNYEIMRINLDGSGMINLSNHPSTDRVPRTR
jgi:TolB protein